MPDFLFFVWLLFDLPIYKIGRFIYDEGQYKIEVKYMREDRKKSMIEIELRINKLLLHSFSNERLEIKNYLKEVLE